MNELISFNVTDDMTMSSREIAELTGKRHDHVFRDIEKLNVSYADISLPKIGLSDYISKRGKIYREFMLTKMQCFDLMTGYDTTLRIKVNRRWAELEAKVGIQLPGSFAEALRLAADQAEQLEAQRPKVAFVDNLVVRDTLMTATQIGQKHGMSAVKLNKILDDSGIVYDKRVKRGRVFKQSWVDGGYGELKQTDGGFSQALFTTAGEVKIAGMLIRELVK